MLAEFGQLETSFYFGSDAGTTKVVLFLVDMCSDEAAGVRTKEILPPLGGGEGLVLVPGG